MRWDITTQRRRNIIKERNSTSGKSRIEDSNPGACNRPIPSVAGLVDEARADDMEEDIDEVEVNVVLDEVASDKDDEIA